MLTRPKTTRKRHCPHVHLQRLKGAVAITLGFQLQCTDCWTLLDGPGSLADVVRDPLDHIPAQEDWYQGKVIELG